MIYDILETFLQNSISIFKECLKDMQYSESFYGGTFEPIWGFIIIFRGVLNIVWEEQSTPAALTEDRDPNSLLSATYHSKFHHFCDNEKQVLI